MVTEGFLILKERLIKTIGDAMVTEGFLTLRERLIKTIGDAMVTEGFLAAGYEYVAIDDCWPADKRDSKGRLQPDPRRFPSGFKALADYVSL